MKYLATALAVSCALALPAHAQSGGMATAANPAGLVKLLQGAGYAPKLDKDDYGDPLIELEIAGYQATVLFYGCDETSHDGCTSLQLRAGFDRDEPWTAAEAMAVSKKYRFASIWLDDSGDPWVQWDVLTNSGIPAQVFLDSVEVFGDTLEDTAELVFAD